MGSHLVDGEFQSDKYPTTPRGKVPLSVKDPTAQDLLWQYAQRRRAVDSEFSDDLETALKAAGFEPPAGVGEAVEASASMINVGDRVYHRRSDLFGSVESIDDGRARVKYEWPFDQSAEPRDVPLDELVQGYTVG